MRTLDMHCDTLMHCAFKWRDDIEKGDLFELDGQVDLKRLSSAGAVGEFFAVYMPPADSYITHWNTEFIEDEEYIADCVQIFEQSVARHTDIAAKALNAEDVEKNIKAGKVSCILTMEDGRAVLGKLENLKRFYDMGFRALSLTHNYTNCFGTPNSLDPRLNEHGLNPFGKEAVEYMQELGMLVDVSHLSDGGFWDVADICKKPFIATHSNARAVAGHQRNLKDDMLRALAERGGVTGLNLCPPFIEFTEGNTHTSLEGCVKHIKHIVNVAGIETMGLGSDFDGIFGTQEVGDVSQFGKLADALKKEGFSEDDIEKIFWKNTLRVMREACK
ncbi:MAG: dipeptidase [Firmicutes bacterium]|nr:dipeptidase [Bacillota bacterium]